MSKPGSSQARLIGIVVFLLTIALGEFAALVLNYQNNQYLRQYVSDNLTATIATSIGLLVLASGLAYIVSRRASTGKTTGPHVPVFGRIGSFVGRRWKLIIIFWILLFIGGFPLAQRLGQVVTSNTGGGQSGTSESARAAQLMSLEFPRPKANTSAIIILQGSNVTDNPTKGFTLSLEQQLLVPGQLNSVENVTSVYSIMRPLITFCYVKGYGYSPTAAQTQANQDLRSNTFSQLLAFLSACRLPVPQTVLQGFISPDKTVMLVIVDFSKSPGSFASANNDPIVKNVITMRSIISELKSTYGAPSQTYVTGDLATSADSSLASDRDLGLIEPVTIGAILILTGLFFFAIATPFVPLTIVGMALLIAEGG
ncbi:MAG TPA: MMPL family transporter, partial [Candidatus Bathyarchaeia archaeon]|nr:MMPL family transporter [Candidatus Bathyarchaeia archaeon]